MGDCIGDCGWDAKADEFSGDDVGEAGGCVGLLPIRKADEDGGQVLGRVGFPFFQGGEEDALEECGFSRTGIAKDDEACGVGAVC